MTTHNQEQVSSATGEDRAERECNFRSFAVAFCAGTISGLTIGQAQYGFATFVDAISDEFSTWSRVQINAALSVGMVVNGLISPLSGTAMHKVSVRFIVPSAGLLCATGWFCISAANSLSALYLGSALIYTAWPPNTAQQVGKIVSTWFPQSRGKIMGIVTASNNIGGVLMIILSSQVRWRLTAVLFAVLQVAISAMYFIVVRDSPERSRKFPASLDERNAEQHPQVSAAEILDDGSKQAIPAAPLRSMRFLVLCFTLCLCFATYPACLSQLYPALLADGVDSDTATGCLSLVGVLGVASKVLSGFVSDKINAKRTMQISLAVQIASLALLVLYGSLPTATRGVALAWVAAGVYGSGFGAVGTLIPLITLEEFGVKEYGKAVGIAGLTYILPGLACPVISGAIFDHTGQYTKAFIVYAALFAIAMLLLEGLCRSKQAPTIQPREACNVQNPDADNTRQSHSSVTV